MGAILSGVSDEGKSGKRGFFRAASPGLTVIVGLGCVFVLGDPYSSPDADEIRLRRILPPGNEGLVAPPGASDRDAKWKIQSRDQRRVNRCPRFGVVFSDCAVTAV